MASNSIALFVNPTAGRGRSGRRLSRVIELFDDAGIDCAVHRSEAVGHLEELVHVAVSGGTRNIVVAGGDGSIHEAVNGIMRADGAAGLGVIPAGTGNDFAKASDIPLEWEHATQLLAARIVAGASSRTIDVGTMNGRFFANGAGIGFDAKVTQVARSYRWPIGDLVYLFAIFRCMAEGIATPHLTIEADEHQWNGPVTLANVSNGPWVGGMFHIAPMAANDDGKLELLIADPVTRRRLVTILPTLMRGQHVDEPEIFHAGVRRVRISASAPVPSHLDGEVQAETTEFDIGILPGALNLL